MTPLENVFGDLALDQTVEDVRDRLPPALDGDGGLLVHVQNPDELGLTDTELRASPVPVNGTVAVSNPGLTDTELRATPVDVQGPLTDVELRAAPVPVSGTLAVSNPGLTDAELRASAVPVSVAGVATAANQATEIAGLAAIDAKTPDTSGAYGYATGVSSAGVVLSGGKRVTKISALNSNLVTAGSVNVNGMGAIPLPAGASVELDPGANLVDPTIVFTGTTSYVVEYVV